MITISYNNAIKNKNVITEEYTKISLALELRFEKFEALLNSLEELKEHVETQLDKIIDAREKLLEGGNLNEISDEVEA